MIKMLLVVPASVAVWGATIAGAATVTPLSWATRLTADDAIDGRPTIRPVVPAAKTQDCAPMPCTVPSISVLNPLAMPVKRSDIANTRAGSPHRNQELTRSKPEILQGYRKHRVETNLLAPQVLRRVGPAGRR